MADTSSGYAYWIRTQATDTQIIGIRDQRDRLIKDCATLQAEVERLRGIAGYVRYVDWKNAEIEYETDSAQMNREVHQREGERS